MTISSTTRISQHNGNGSASTFAFSFKVFAASDLLVTRLTTSTGVQTTLALTTDYTVTLNGNQNTNPGGSITLVAGPLAVGLKLTITSDIANLQPTDLTNQGGFYPEVITDSLDRATIQTQQLADDINRSISAPISDSSPNMQLPVAADRANKVLGFDDSGNVVALTTEQFQSLIATFGGSNTVPQTWALVGTGGNTYSLSPAPLNTVAAIFLVEMGGVIQDPSTYTITSNAIVFDANVPAGLPVSVRNFGVARTLTDSVSSSMLVAESVTTAKIATSAVIEGKLASDCVTTTKVANDAITYAKIQNVSSTDRILGRSSAGAGDVQEIICTAAGRALLDDVDAIAQRATLSLGSLAVVNEVANANVSATANISFAKLQTVAANSLLGNNTASAAAAASLNADQTMSLLGAVTWNTNRVGAINIMGGNAGIGTEQIVNSAVTNAAPLNPVINLTTIAQSLPSAFELSSNNLRPTAATGGTWFVTICILANSWTAIALRVA